MSALIQWNDFIEGFLRGLKGTKHYQYILLMAFIVAVYRRLSRRKEALPHFALFLGICAITETVIYSASNSLVGNNTIWQNLYMLFCLNYYFYVFYLGNLKSTPRFSRPVKVIWLIIDFFMLINFFFWQGMFGANTFSWSLQCLILVALVMLYYSNMLSSPNTKTLIKEPLFILSIGILFLYGMLFPYVLNYSQLIELDYIVEKSTWRLVVLANTFLSIAYLIISSNWIFPIGYNNSYITAEKMKPEI